jgi:small neutral amino acid transporter SnatA (MarC family)
LGKRRQKESRRRRTSTADLRFTFVLLVVAGAILVLGSALVSQLRAAQWTSAAVSGAIILFLVAVSLYSASQRRRS